MSLKLISVRVPESTHTYFKVKAAAEGKTFQQIANEALNFFQKNDPTYQAQLDQSVTESLNALAQFAEQSTPKGVAHGV